MGGRIDGRVLPIVDGDAEPLQGREVVLRDVAINRLTRSDGDTLLAPKGQVASRLDVNVTGVCGCGDEHRLDFYGFLAVDVAELHTHHLTADREVDDLPEGPTRETTLGHVARSREFYCRGPSAGPLRSGLCKGIS